MTKFTEETDETKPMGLDGWRHAIEPHQMEVNRVLILSNTTLLKKSNRNRKL